VLATAKVRIRPTQFGGFFSQKQAERRDFFWQQRVAANDQEGEIRLSVEAYSA
jgi:hypothetical protein